MISGVILSLVLIIAAWTDWRWRLIHNSLTYPAILCGLAWNSLGSYGVEYLPSVQGAAWATPQLLGCIGLPASILGGTICFVLMLSVYMTGGAGGGDVKLATVIGVYLGIPAGLIVLMLAFVVAAGWVLCASIYRSGWRGRIARLWQRDCSILALLLTCCPISLVLPWAPAGRIRR